MRLTILSSKAVFFVILLAASALSARATVRYVNVSNSSPASPYTSWATAAVRIQDAIDAGANGDEIVVTNGTYQTGGRVVYGSMTNRVVVNKAVYLHSVNGPGATTIQGYQVPGTTNGNAAVRCAYLIPGATLAGFTLTNGATRAAGDRVNEQSGGGVWGAPSAPPYFPFPVVSNCVLIANAAMTNGGGAYQVALTNCTLVANSAQTGGGAFGGVLQYCVLSSNSVSFQGGGANSATLVGCSFLSNSAGYSGGGAVFSKITNCTFTSNSALTWGGGVDNSTLSNCTLVANSAPIGAGTVYSTHYNCFLTANSAATYGGGAGYGTLNNSVLSGNSAPYGGGAHNSTLNNCTLTGNSAALLGGGAYASTVNNCILYYNFGPAPNYYGGTLNYCCTTPLPSGTGNLAAEPQLASSSHISADSPCRGAGNAASVKGVDIDGQAWTNPPSIGCDEFYATGNTGLLTAAIQTSSTNVVPGFSLNLTALISGQAAASQWDFGDGLVVSNRPCISHAWAGVGDYPVVLRAYNDQYPGGVTASVTIHVSPAVHYVAAVNTSPLAPYTSWATAATNIQDAVEAVTTAGALVLVNDGVYVSGGRVATGALTNRAAVMMPLVLQSVNGPGATVISGYQVPGATNGDSAVRCVYLTTGAVLTGFTVTNGATRAAGDPLQEQSGGGIWSAAGSIVSNCVVTGNAAAYGGGGGLGTFLNSTLAGNVASYGGGAYRSILNNCTMTGNLASSGGAAYYSTLNNSVLMANGAKGNGGGLIGGSGNNCTFTGNWAAGAGGGASAATLNNCIVYYNLGTNAPNCDGGALNYSCTTPLPSNGLGNTQAEPLLASSSHLSAGSPCRGTGSSVYATGTDIDGEAWANPPSMGCDELYAGTANGPLTVRVQADYATVMPGYAVNVLADIGGEVNASQWDFGDGTTLSNHPYASHAWAALGDYPLVLRAYNDSSPGGISATVMVHVVAQPVHYVAATNPSPVAPYTSWVTAATNIQDAVDAATTPGALVLVNDGVYAAGGRVLSGKLTNRVAVTMPLVVQSLNGPAATVIQGYQLPGVTNGDSAVRCVYLASGAALVGFTLENGATRAAGDSLQEQSGGGVFCGWSSSVVSNCVLSANAASVNAGGAYSGTLWGCMLTGNYAPSGGGACSSALTGCTLSGNRAQSGGGAYGGSLSNCTLTTGSASNGGGAYQSTLVYCTLSGNSAVANGGGACSATLTNCTLSGNSAYAGGGAFSSMLDTCLLLSNSVPWQGGGTYAGTVTNCTFTANSAGTGGGAYTGALYACTLRLNSASQDGGGVYSGLLDNCVLASNAAHQGGGASTCALNRCMVSSNSASYAGGGVYNGSARNSVIAGNEATIGGGTSGAILTNCTVTGNWAVNTGGSSFGTLYNSIVYFNQSALPGPNYDGSTALSYSCSTPLPSGVGNFSADPQLASASHLSASSPCHATGSPLYATGTDIDGEPWGSPPSVGCDEFLSGAVTGALNVAIAGPTNLAVGFAAPFRAQIAGRVGASAWDFGSGMIVSNQPYTTHSWTTPGAYSVVLRAWNESNAGGVSATVLVQVVQSPVSYVSAGNLSPVWPFLSWATAATNIQDAVDAVALGGEVVVTNGLYATGGRVVVGSMTNRVTVDRPIALRSVNGPQFTVIQGYQIPTNSNGDGAIRCVYLTSGAVLSGFTLTHGATRAAGDYDREQCGGGVWCESFDASVSNCVVVGNSAYLEGGGSYFGTLNRCTLSSNSAYEGGGEYMGNLVNCTLTSNSVSEWGGGAYLGTLNQCTLTGNAAVWNGAGAYNATLSNCLLTGNSARQGGGASFSTLNNCTVVGNTAVNWGGGTEGGTMNNCILYSNTAPTMANYQGGDINYCCTTPQPGGPGDLDLDPRFVNYAGGNLRLQSTSPCINSSRNAYASGPTDLDGNARIVAGTVDIGAYEYQGTGSVVSYAWLRQYGMPTDGSADYLDPDHDGMNNWQEWVAGTSPTNAASVLRMLAPTINGTTVTVVWTSVANRTYSLEWATNLAAPFAFSPLQTNIAGLAGTTTLTLSNAAGVSPGFYRVLVVP